MQSWQRTWQTIAGQLKSLPPAAKMLIGSIMIILVMSLFLVSLYAGRQTLVPLGLTASVGAEARARAISYLKGSGISHEVAGTDVMVPADQRDTILAYLTETQVIGADQINFDRLMSDDSPFRTRDQNRQRYLVAKMNVLSALISNWTGIERATVVIDASENGAIGKSRIGPSASVDVRTRGGELTQGQVDAMARLVANSHSGLKPSNVAIIDARAGRSHQVRNDETLAGARYMEIKLENERHVKSTLEDALRYIPGVFVAVNAQVDVKRVTLTSQSFDEPKIAPLEDMSDSLTSSGPTGGAEPGVQSNVGLSLASSAKSGAQMTHERTQQSTVPFVGKKTTTSDDSKGYPLQINASIGIPKTYFVRLFQDQTGDFTKPPDQAQLDGVIKAETERIKSHVTPLIATTAMENAVAGVVTVDMVPDFGAVVFGEQTRTELVKAGNDSGSGAAGFMSESLAKSVGLGGLALVSLAMMFLIVRKAGARPELPTASELVGIPPALAAAESDLVGEADEASPALEGVELNDDAIRRQQMLDQITEMIRTTPDDAAGLMRRWMKSEA